MFAKDNEREEARDDNSRSALDDNEQPRTDDDDDDSSGDRPERPDNLRRRSEWFQKRTGGR